MKKKVKKKIILHRLVIALAVLVFIVFGIIKAISSLANHIFNNSPNQPLTSNQEETYTELTLSVVRRFNDAFTSGSRWSK